MGEPETGETHVDQMQPRGLRRGAPGVRVECTVGRMNRS